MKLTGRKEKREYILEAKDVIYNDLHSWLYFMLFSAACFTIVIVLMLLRIKFESKKFNQLLKDYKARHNNSKKEF